MKQVATLKKIAETLNLNVSTVSRALNNNPAIAPATRKKVKELADALEYEPNSVAVQLRTNNSKLFGLITPAISSYFYNSFIGEVEKECRKNNYSLLILQSGENDSMLENALYACRQNRVNGIFVCTDNLKELDEFFKLKEQGIEVIFFDKVPDTNAFSKVCLGDEKAAALTAEHIIQKNKKSILALFGNKELSITIKRLESFKKKFAEACLNIELKIETGINFDNAKNLTREYLSKNNSPDCIFCMSDEILAGTMRAVLESNIKYPQDVGIIAISHGFFPTLYYPEITYAETNGCKLGKLAFNEMLKSINEKIKPKGVFLESVLIKSGSI